MTLRLKRVTENELELLMNWRMSEEVNRYLKTSPKLTLEGQHKWFEKIKNDDTEIRWILWADDIPVGHVFYSNIDNENQRCYGPGWFIVEKKYLDLKQVINLHRNCCAFAFDVLGMNRIYGDVMSINTGVVKLVQVCGYEIEGVLKEHVVKDGIPRDMTLVGLTKDQWNKKNLKYEKIEIEY